MRTKGLVMRRLCKFFTFGIMFVITSCESFLDVDLTDSQITNDKVFDSDVTATSAVTGVYYEMLSPQNFASGSISSITVLAGLSSDELITYSPDADFQAVAGNDLRSDNRYVLEVWRTIYKVIYQANAVIEGVNSSQSISPSAKSQLLGEMYFVRAFCYFYLVNLFGDVPLVKDTDYRNNASIGRSEVAEVYNFIVADLEAAQRNLSKEYVTDERVRPNQSVANALMARVNLYRGEWQQAEIQSTQVIENSSYSLESAGNVFQRASIETIWQLMPVDPNFNTQEGYYFILTSNPKNNSMNSMAVSRSLQQDFEPNDSRIGSWLNSFIDEADTLYFPFKYKIKNGVYPQEEYSIVFRLAEQYLIRSEARAQSDNLPDAISDLDVIRSRAGLPLLTDTNPTISKSDLLTAIQEERRRELFTEWGHRWFDLKRSGRIDDEMNGVKASWSSHDALYPIPQLEREKNPQLGQQNDGY